MLVGCLIRHFKVYENVVFTPITLGIDGNFTVFTGNNGVGKSSILEAVNHFFHQNKWIVTSNQKKSEAYIAPLFLISKDEFQSNIPSDVLDSISNYFWNFTETANPTISKNESLKEFMAYRDKLKTLHDSNSYYLFLVGLKYPSEAPNFATFDSDIREKIAGQGLNVTEIEKIYKEILNFYSYAYIAVSGRVRDTSTQEAIEINRLE